MYLCVCMCVPVTRVIQVWSHETFNTISNVLRIAHTAATSALVSSIGQKDQAPGVRDGPICMFVCMYVGMYVYIGIMPVSGPIKH